MINKQKDQDTLLKAVLASVPMSAMMFFINSNPAIQWMLLAYCLILSVLMLRHLFGWVVTAKIMLVWTVVWLTLEGLQYLGF